MITVPDDDNIKDIMVHQMLTDMNSVSIATQ